MSDFDGKLCAPTGREFFWAAVEPIDQEDEPPGAVQQVQRAAQRGSVTSLCDSLLTAISIMARFVHQDGSAFNTTSLTNLFMRKSQSPHLQHIALQAMFCAPTDFLVKQVCKVTRIP